MLDFNRSPFNFLPINNGDLSDMTCEYLISLLEKLNTQYHALVDKTIKITQSLPNANFEHYKDCFTLVENLIDNYGKLVKSTKLSLGIPVASVKSKHTIFESFSYLPNILLQDLVVHGLRNSAQHFEERLQDYHTQIDPFLQLSYTGQHINWQITFGKGGYSHNGSSDNHHETFLSENIHFQSYKKEKGVPIKEVIKLNDVWTDINEIAKLLEENVQNIITTKGICCPPVRNLSIFMMPD